MRETHGDLRLFRHCCCARAVVLFHCDPLLTRRIFIRPRLLPTRETKTVGSLILIEFNADTIFERPANLPTALPLQY